MFKRNAALWFALLLTPSAALAAVGSSGTHPAVPGMARYDVRILGRTPMRLGVKARLPISGRELEMAESRPGDVPELAQRGWPALVGQISVSDEHGRALELESSPRGWRLAQPRTGWIDVSYEVDYSVLASQGWPALREAAYGDGDTFTAIGRSVFISTPASGSIEVEFELPRGWHATTAWPGGRKRFSVASVADLTENLLVLGRSPPARVRASGFQVSVVALGSWKQLDRHFAPTLEPLLQRYVQLMALAGEHRYLVVLLPGNERGGESFRSSFAMTMAGVPTRGNRHEWGSVLGHEIFHYWNGWRLRGADYAATQWFQEGFTEYVAVKAMLDSGLMTPGQFLENISAKVNASRRLQTPLDAPGNRKGPPLYGAGALVALSWDLEIRERSGGRKNLDHFLRALWDRTGQGRRTYGAPEILASLEETSPGEWPAFYQRHLAAREPLPLAATLAPLGLRIVDDAEGQARVAMDPSASAAARARWLAFSAGH